VPETRSQQSIAGQDQGLSRKWLYWLIYRGLSRLIANTPLYIAFAGLYDAWQHADGEKLSTFTIITIQAGPFMAWLHHRMPVILARAWVEAWIDPELTQVTDVLDILAHSTGLEWDAYPVVRMVN
jgi:putative SOS response-associated peptidase YedK